MSRAPRHLLALFALGSSLLARSAADGLTSGQYQFSAELAAACLDGAYPCSMGNHDGGLLTVTTDSHGRLTGMLYLRSIETAIAGKIRGTRKALRLALAGGGDEGRFKLKAQLKGDRFAGTAKAKGKAIELLVDVSDAGKLVVDYDLVLAVDAAGRVTGTGSGHGLRRAAACDCRRP